VPGLAILRLLRAPVSLWTCAAIASPISFGFIYLMGLIATHAGVSTQTMCFLAMGVLVAVWVAMEAVRLATAGPLVARARTAWRGFWPGSWREGPRDLPLAASRVLLFVAVVGGVGLWSITQSRLTVPAGWDAMHHGYFVRQIVDHHTLRPQVVLSSDPGRSDGTAGFYPLAANLVAALLHVASGIRISTILIASLPALAGVLLPCGSYVLIRRMAPRLPLVAALAALASVLPARLYTIIYTGRITAVLGMALVPAVVAVVLLFGRRIDWRAAVLVPLVAIGLFGVHTSEVPIAVGLVLAICVSAAIATHTWRATLTWLGYLVGLGALAGIAMYLVVPSFVHLVGDRTGSFGPATGYHFPVSRALRDALVTQAPTPAHNSVPMAVWSVLALFGCLASVHPRLRRLAGFTVAYLCYAAFFFLWLWGHVGPLRVLADSWYRNPDRMLWEYTVLGAAPVGIALWTVGVVIYNLGSRARSHTPRSYDRPRTRYAWLVAAVAAIAVLVGFAVPPVKTDAAWLRTYASPVSGDAQRAFNYLAAHVGPNGRVLDDLENRGELWMYVDNGVRTLFGSPPGIGDAPASWKDRLYLRGQLRHINTDGCVGQLLRSYQVEYVYYSQAKMWAGKPKMSLTLLRSLPFVHQVFVSGGVRIFAVTPPQSTLPCTRDMAARYPWSTLSNAN
jgi:hypothetical protein